MRRALGVLVAAAVALAAAVVGPAAGVAAAAALGARGSVRIDPSDTPAFDGDAPDPQVVQVDGTYYAFTTGTVLGNHIQALIDTTGDPTTGWRSYTGHPYGSSALPTTPAWQRTDSQTSPSVAHVGDHWALYYDASPAQYPAFSGHDCLAVATAASLTPSSPVFTDVGHPLWCDDGDGGAIDPSAFVDPATGAAYLVWKTNDGGSRAPSRVFSVALTADGLGFAGSPQQLVSNASGAPAWQTTDDDPQLSFVAGQYALLFSAGDFLADSYDEALATCVGPLGPCTIADAPFLTSHAGASGTGGGALFTDAAGATWLAYAAWRPGCVGYGTGCGGARRLFVAPTGLSRLQPFVAHLYQDLFHRAVDAGGSSYWVGRILRDLGSPGGLTSLLATTDEYRRSVVDDVYVAFFHRHADAGGLAYWSGRMAAGTTTEGIETEILGSDEYFTGQAGGSVEAYVDAVYAALLQRAPDAGGRAYWVGQLRAGVPRPAVGAALVGSNEAYRVVVRSAYQRLLGRATDPAGEAYWADRLQHGLTDVALLATITSLDEYDDKP